MGSWDQDNVVVKVLLIVVLVPKEGSPEGSVIFRMVKNLLVPPTDPRAVIFVPKGAYESGS